MALSNLEEKILKHVNHEDYRPVKPRVIAQQLKLEVDEFREVRRAVKRLTKQNKIQYGSNHLVYPQKGTSKNEITGRFSRASSGYGFVRPEGTSHGVGRGKDIYVPLSKTKDAASGDTVLVKVNARPRGGEDRIRGEILRVLKRRTNQFVGTYFENRGRAFVTVDGRIFDEPVSVGDPGAKSAAPQDKVVIEIVRFPSKNRTGEAVITEVLGDHRKPGVDTLTVMREFDLPDAFPEAALEDSRREAALFDETIGDHRRDLTGHTVITIDPLDARDFDDAISLEFTEKGNWLLGVHIADVSHFVRPGTALDEEAKDRATSIYLPDRVIPMLPEVISNNLASLQPDKVRYTKTAFIEFTPDGVPMHTEICTSAIRSKRRFSYEEVDQFLEDRESWKTKLEEDVFRLLGEMHGLAITLRKRRFDLGALAMDMPEIKLEFDKHGKVAGAHKTENTESHQTIEEFMLAANMAVAEYLRDHELLFLRRVHPSPTRRKIKKLTEFVNLLGFRFESLQSRFELKRLLATIEGTPQQYTVTLAILQSMQKAVYSPEPEGHYALASRCYCHFTSPIRRYPDLTVHRLIEAIEKNKRPGQDIGRLMTLGDHCSDRERRADVAERELTKLKLLGYFESRIGQRLNAVVAGVETYGVFVRGVELPVEGLINVDSMTDDYYEFDEAQFALIGKRSGRKFQLGDVVEVEVATVDMVRREIDFRCIQHISSCAPRVGSPAGKSGRRKNEHRSKDGRKSVSSGKRKPKGEQKKRKTKRRKKNRRK
jgi:ribonuclease R